MGILLGGLRWFVRFQGIERKIIDKEVLSIFGFENEVLKQCGIAKERFHKVRGVQWEGVYQEIAQRFADKKKIWKNGMHFQYFILVCPVFHANKVRIALSHEN